MRARTLILSICLIMVVTGSLLLAREGFSASRVWAATTPPCAVSYQLNSWSGGFTAQVQLTNNGAALNGWTLTWSFSGNQHISSAWNTQITQNGSAVSASNQSFNASLPTSGSVQFGFQATFSGTNAAPNDFALNGASCEAGSTPTATAIPITPTPTTPPVTPTATATPPAGTSCGTALFCDNFENQSGSTPSGAWQVSYPNCQGTGTVTVDHTVAHSGTTSIRVDGHNGYCNHVFFGTTSAFTGVGTDIHVRFFIRHTTALPTGHVAFTAMKDTNDGNNDLRFGGQNAALQWNRQSDDATLPEQSPAGVALSTPLPTNVWSCVEFEVNEAQGTMRTWLNGSEVAGLHLDTVPTTNIDGQWINSRPNWRPSLADLRLGWESYSGGDDTLWFDDVAVGPQQIGCGS